MARTVFDRTKEFISDAVQNGDEFAALQTQNMQRVMRLTSVEPKRVTGTVSRWQIETVHKNTW